MTVADIHPNSVVTDIHPNSIVTDTKKDNRYGTDRKALEALEELCATEGILTALETAHAYAAARIYAQENPGKRILIGNSGRGDKDMPTLTKIPARIRS